MHPEKLTTPPNEPSESPHLCKWRLNLLASHNDKLYLAVDCDIYEYSLVRSNGLQIVPVKVHTFTPPSTVNNVSIAQFPPKYGGPTLLAAGGDAAVGNSRGSLSMLRLSSSSPAGSIASSGGNAEAFFLTNLKSAWGIDACPSTGQVALSTNSHASVVLQLQANEPTAAPALVYPAINCTHFENIPCVAFSRFGSLLASASIDTTFAIYDVSKPSRSRAQRIIQSPQRDPNDGEAEWCWRFTWINQSTPRCTPVSDPAWESIDSRRCFRAVTPTKNTDDTDEEAKQNASSAESPKLSQQMGTQKRRRSRSQMYLPLYDDFESMSSDTTRRLFRKRPRNTTLHTASDLETDSQVGTNGENEDDVDDELPDETQSYSEFMHRIRRETKDGDLNDSKDNEEDEDLLFCVARQSILSLNRMVGRTGWEQLDCIEPFASRSTAYLSRRDQGFRIHARLSDCVELPELSAVLVVEQFTGGIAIVRIVRQTGAGLPNTLRAQRYALVVEGIIPSTPHTWMAGWTVIRRIVPDANDAVVYEVFMLDVEGMLQAYEVARQSSTLVFGHELLV